MMQYVVVARGTRFEIRALRRPGDTLSLVGAYLADLEEAQHKKVVKAIRLTAERGPTHNREKYEKFTSCDNLYQIKEKPSRIPFFYDGPGTIVLTHGFRKRGNKTPQREVENALRLREMYFESREQY